MIRCNSFAFFPKNQRRWVSPAYRPSTIDGFQKACSHDHYNMRTDILPHGSYLINLGNPDVTKRQQSQQSFEDDLKRCEQLGVGLYNFHPGSAVGGADKQETIAHIADGINKAIEKTEFVKVVLENMAGHGNIIGSNLQDLAEIIKQVQNKERVGVCIDTCHAFAAGYDLRTKEVFDVFWKQFAEIVGYRYLSGIHLNDSKAPLGSKRDLHQNIGLGFLGLEPFRLLMNKKEVQGIPMVLETPVDETAVAKQGVLADVRAEEIKLLEWLVGKEADDQEFLEKAKELQKKGEKEREEQQQKFDAKKEKEAVKRRKTKKVVNTDGDAGPIKKQKVTQKARV